ncbi:MAG: flagellar export protein FliJ [Treponema sp.]|nr:flagellar export protein FliJ [Treponema sp.]
MKKFEFELEEILNIRRFEQQQAEVELGKALAEEKKVQDKIDNLAMQQVTVKQQMKGCTNFSDIINANQFYSFVKKQTDFLLNQMAELKLVSEQKRDVLRNAMQKTDSLEKLKEQQLEEYKAEVKRIEQLELDNIVTTRYKNE